MASTSFIFAIIFSSLAVVGAIMIVLSKIYPNRDKWIAEFRHNSTPISTLELQQTLSKDNRLSWTSPEPQQKNDAYKIDLHKSRVIDGIEFYEKCPSNEFPYGWTLLLLNEWGGLVRRPIQFSGERIVTTFPVTKIRAIQIVISNPMIRDDGTAYHWRIENVYLREVRLFGRLRVMI